MVRVGDGIETGLYLLPSETVIEYKGLDDDYRKYWYLTADQITWYRFVENSSTEEDIKVAVDRMWTEVVKPDFIVDETI